jgi:glyoxylase-like metal-dependent hydrolase (beta-lactamase superfamily II)
MLRHSLGLALLASALATPAVPAQQPVVRTANPVKRGLKASDFPRTITVAANVEAYEDFHAGLEKFTTTNMFVVTDAGVLVADRPGSVAETKRLVDAIRAVAPRPIMYVVVASDHGDHTAGNASFPRRT